MRTNEYDELLDRIRFQRGLVEASRKILRRDKEDLDDLLSLRDQEEHRLAQQALAHMPIASRKLVVGE